MLKENEKIESLGRGVELIVSPSHTFGTDALLLSDFANIRKKDKAVDLGTGCGIIPMLWCREEYPAEIYGVDIQPLAISQLSRSIELSNLSGRMFAVNCDLCSREEMRAKLGHAQFDLVTMNPPYKPQNTGIESASAADKIARHETMCTLPQIAEAAADLLKFGGRFCLCLRPERLCDILCSMRDALVEPKRIRFVVQKEGLTPWLVLVEGKRGGKPGLTVEPNFVLQNKDGSYTDEMNEIMREYAKKEKF